MSETILLVGVACVVAAIVGGGLKVVNVQIPVLHSLPRQLMLGTVGVAVVGSSFFVAPDASRESEQTKATSAQSNVVAGQSQEPSPVTQTSPVPVSQPANTSGFQPPPESAAYFGPGNPTITLSKASGPPGTELTVSGQGYGPGEAVRIRLHTTELAKVTTDSNGAFAATAVRIPADWKFKSQYYIIASGDQSLRSTREPFQIT